MHARIDTRPVQASELTGDDHEIGRGPLIRRGAPPSRALTIGHTGPRHTPVMPPVWRALYRLRGDFRFAAAELL